ncbi:MAG: glycosyltransferase family 4 protein [bacterium]
MKLAFLMHGGVDRSGVNRVIPAFLWFLERLAKRHDVHVFCLDQEPEPGDWPLLGMHVHNTGPARGWRRRLFSGFAAEHRRAPFDVIHGFFGWGGTYGALLGWRHFLPVMFHAEGSEFVALDDIGYGMRCTARGRFELRIACAGARRVTVASKYQQSLAASLGIVAEHVTIGVALEDWPVIPPRPRNASHLARLLHVGDLRGVKDQRTLLAAANIMRDSGLSFHLDVAGFDTMRGELQQSVDSRSLGDMIHWHGHLDRRSLRALMEQADLLLVTSRHEAGPVVVLEAAIAGVPTVGTAVGHVSDWSPEAAVAIAAGDAAALARETMSLLMDEPRRLAVARAAQHRAVALNADFTAAVLERMSMEATAS